jgi:hypothetical protein
VTPGEVCDWVKDDPGERFTALRSMDNEVQLLKYVNSHKYDIEQALGITVSKEGTKTWLLLPGKTSRRD